MSLRTGWGRIGGALAALLVGLSVLAGPPLTAATRTAPTTVLALKAGSGRGQIGITATDGPSAFRIAADGTIRIMDTVNRRLLFFNGRSGRLASTIDLKFTKRPTDFVVTGQGDLYVLDAGAWTIEHLSIRGARLGTVPISAALKGRFSTLSLTADGRLVGLGTGQGYVLVNNGSPIPLDSQPRARVQGVVTVRSNALFSIAPDSTNRRQSLLIDYGAIAPRGIDLGAVQGTAAFLDVNQGMEPYVAIQRRGSAELRRYAVDGQLLGTLTLDQSGARRALRPIYVDRPGAVYTMNVTRTGLTIQRYVMAGAGGRPLPLYSQLVTTAPWSPGSLQAAVG